MSQKIRLDQYLVDFGISLDLTEAKAMIMANKVLVNDEPIDKVGKKIAMNSIVRIRGKKDYPSRAAYKLIAALDHFNVILKDKVVLDCGCSHGGFTKVLLEREVKKVIAVDVAYGIFDLSLRDNPQVELLERVNIRHLQFKQISQTPDLFVADLSFISLRLVLSHLKKIFISMQGLLLFKPQFEAKPIQLKGGILSDQESRDNVLQLFLIWLKENDIMLENQTSNILKGKSGNQEIFLHIHW